MQPRRLMLAMLGGGTVLGLLLGLTTQTEIVARNAPEWTSAPAATPSTDSFAWVESGPQDLSTGWDSTSRLPTWKRREPAMQQAASAPLADFAEEPAMWSEASGVRSDDADRWEAMHGQITRSDAAPAIAEAPPAAGTALSPDAPEAPVPSETDADAATL